MKKYSILLLTLVFALAMSSCYKETDWIDENTTTEGKHFPVIPSFSVLTEAGEDGYFHSGDEVKTEVNYWSIDPINELSLIVSDVTIETKPYVHDFNEETQMDHMFFDYVVPAIAAGDTLEIELVMLIKNTNGLTATKSTSITVVE